jgi:hypothetical protein
MKACKVHKMRLRNDIQPITFAAYADIFSNYDKKQGRNCKKPVEIFN